MRKLTILTLALLYVVALATVSTFAANASRVDNNLANIIPAETRMVPIDSRQFPLIDDGTSTPSTSGSKSDATYTALGYFMSPGFTLGFTSYDLQHNMRMARQVEVGTNGRVHFVWTAAPLPFDAAARAVWYTSYNPATGVFAPEAFSVSEQVAKTPGRFCTVDVFSNRALVVNHYGATLTTSALDISSGGGTFTAEDTPSGVVNCQNIYAGGATAATFQKYIWPVAASDVDPVGNKLVIHIAASEGNTGAGASGIAYFRGVSAGTTIDPGMYGTCGMFVDSSNATGYDIAASPYNNDVVIVYPKARGGSTRENNDLAYRLSTDMGQNWGPVVNITNFPTGAKERCSGDLTVLFTADGFFHILYIATIYDSVAGTIGDPEVKLWHWSSGNPTQRSMVLDANTADAACNTPAFEYNVSKVNLTQCHSTSLGKDLLYAVYSRQLGTTLVPDCSFKKYYNQNVFFSPSSTWGETWGAPVNLTNTNTNGCTGEAGNYCADNGSSSSARYVTDSLRIEYMEDLDAGSTVGNESGTNSLLNPIKFISTPCIDMAPYRILTCTPSSIKYPFHAVRNASVNQDLLLVNGGNQSITWNASISGAVPISMPLTGSVPAGYTNSATITATFGPKSTEGLFKGTITFSYDSPVKTFEVPVDFYVFDSWFLPQDVPLRTASNKMMVNQAGQSADDISGASWSYFADNGGIDYITDASLILGNSKDNLSWLIFKGGQGGPTPSNNFGMLYALGNTKVDTTSFSSYRIASGKGTNRDSTVGFDVQWYAAKFVDSADFYIGHFEIYKGLKGTGVSGLDIAFACDWDVPSDTSSDNTVITDPTRQMIALQGQYSSARQQGYAGLAAYRTDAVPITGGFAFGNQQQVYALGGYSVDSVWKYMQATTNYNSTWNDSIGDMSIVMVVAKNYTVTASSRLAFNVVLAAKRAETNLGGLGALNTAVDQARAFITGTVCNTCGDANSDGAVDISDVVFLISHIFSGGAPPAKCGYAKGKGDANGDGTLDISDAVYLISRIFSGGQPPKCQGM